jgi:MOSC domain-containing protein YiiM
LGNQDALLCEALPVIDADLPAGGAPELVRSFAACMASVTETPVDEVPQPEADLAGAMAYWRGWLAARGMGLVGLVKPRTFNWPGYWLAVLDPPEGGSARAVLMFGTPSGVVLSPQDPTLLGRASLDLAIHAGYVLSGLDPTVLATGAAPEPFGGTVEAIAIAEHATEEMRPVEHARALAGRGLEGDRYAAKAGTFTPADDKARGYDITLVEAEVLDGLTLPGGAKIDYAEARRNVVTRGIELNALVGRRFRIGDVECLGQRLCEPCSHLERLTTEGALRALIHRGGLRADVLSDGDIKIGDAVATIDQSSQR